jgi:predicted nucleotide-binding protein (sugar kinase/HSP70/actin superfamily)
MSGIGIQKARTFRALKKNVGKYHVEKKTVLIPEMNRTAARLFAATFRSFGVDAKVLETYKGMDLGKHYTSGKECYPCQITLGDILHFVEEERMRLGNAFNPKNYIYFLPESDGPCRFGMYNKYQRIVLNSFQGLEGLKIVSLTAKDGYSLSGIMKQDEVVGFKKAGYLSIVTADILDRLTWRIRPYEKEKGSTDDFIDRAIHIMEEAFETFGREEKIKRIIGTLVEVVKEGKTLLDPNVQRKPQIGIVGEIFLRMHAGANQDLIRLLEKQGAEVVNASLAEWVNYVSYAGLRKAKRGFISDLIQLRGGAMKFHLKQLLKFGTDHLYKGFRQRQAYRSLHPYISLVSDHKVSHLEHILTEEDIFSFDVTTEACLSISSILEYIRTGYNGVVNVYPFTCMPGMTTSAIIKPMMNRLRIPYLDAPYDGSFQPGREAAIRTFMYQAHQHFHRNNGGQGLPIHEAKKLRKNLSESCKMCNVNLICPTG